MGVDGLSGMKSASTKCQFGLTFTAGENAHSASMCELLKKPIQLCFEFFKNIEIFLKYTCLLFVCRYVYTDGQV